MLRYFERHHRLDIDAIRREIATPVLRAAVTLGATGLKVGGGTFKFKDRTASTYIAWRSKL